jgi:hypothetical protein
MSCSYGGFDTKGVFGETLHDFAWCQFRVLFVTTSLCRDALAIVLLCARLLRSTYGSLSCASNVPATLVLLLSFDQHTHRMQQLLCFVSMSGFLSIRKSDSPTTMHHEDKTLLLPAGNKTACP